MPNKLLNRFEGTLTTSKWAKMTKPALDTALRDIKDLLDKDILRQSGEGGRSTNYVLAGNAAEEGNQGYRGLTS